MAMLAVVAAEDLPQPPNVILMMADDLGWGDVGFNGNTVIQTPNLDAMAKNGMRLTRFYTASPLCSPTRGSCLTGRYPWRYGVLPQLNLEFCADRVILRAEGGSQNDPITTNFHRS
jgi:arylsulfatase A-like enzyme